MTPSTKTADTLALYRNPMYYNPITDFEVYRFDMNNERELLKGSTQTLVLAILRDGPRHGYAIAREIEYRSTTGMKFKDGTLYPALQALEREGCIVGTWEVVENAPSRKVYTLTPHGSEELARRTGEWNQFAAMINRILNHPETQTS